jgi:hypothetical protein
VIVVFSTRFEREVEAAIRWRKQHGPPEATIGKEIRWFVELVEANPEMWPIAENARRPGLHRAYLSSIDYHVYYRIDRDRGQIKLESFRHARRRPIRG